MPKPLPSNFYIAQKPEQGESEAAFFNRIRSRAGGVNAMTGGVSHGVDDFQNFFEQYGGDDETLRRLMAQAPPVGTSGTSGGFMQTAQLLTYGAPGTGGNAFLTDYPGAPPPAPEAPAAPSGVIEQHPSAPEGWGIDPATGHFAKITQTPTVAPPPEDSGVISSTNDPYRQAVDDALAANQASIDALNGLGTPPPVSGGGGTPPPGTPQVPTNTQVTSGENVFTPEAQAAQTALEARRTQLQGEQGAEAQSIRDEFAAQRAETERTLTANLEFGKALMAGKGILPATNSQYLQWYTDTTTRNQQALNSVLVSERRALLDAQKAYQAADFDLLDKQLTLAQNMRNRSDQIQMFDADMEMKKADLQLSIAQFQSEVGFKADELNLQQMRFGLERARELRAAGMDQVEIATTVQREVREQAEFERNSMVDIANSIAFNVINETDEEAANSYLQQVADHYGYDSAILGGFVNARLAELEASGTGGEPITEQVGRTLLQYNTETGQWIPVFSDAAGGGQVTDQGTDVTGLFGNAKLTTGQKNDVADMLVLQRQIQSLFALKEKYGGYVGVKGGGLGSLMSWGAKVFGTLKPGTQETRNAIGQVKGFIAKLRGGTSFTVNEQRLLDTYTPGINDSDDVIDSKLNSLNQYVNDKIESIALVAGGTYMPQFSFTAPDGVNYDFSSQAELDEFRRRIEAE